MSILSGQSNIRRIRVVPVWDTSAERTRYTWIVVVDEGMTHSRAFGSACLLGMTHVSVRVGQLLHRTTGDELAGDNRCPDRYFVEQYLSGGFGSEMGTPRDFGFSADNKAELKAKIEACFSDVVITPGRGAYLIS